MDDCDVYHIKVTESLLRSVEKLHDKNYSAQLTSSAQGLSLCLTVDDAQSTFHFEPEAGSRPNYFHVAAQTRTRCQILGPISGRLRTLADDESFKHARACLLKDVEENRQQKMKTLIYQAESASTLKSERIETARRALRKTNIKSNKLPDHGIKATKAKPTLKILPSTTNSFLSSKSEHKKINPKSTNRKLVTLNKPITVGKPDLPSGGSILSISEYVSKQTVRDHCLRAIERRQTLEKRLETALVETDVSIRNALIDSIRTDLFALVDDLRSDPLLKEIKTPVTARQ